MKGRRLSFFGHMGRLPDNAVKLALDEFRNTKTKKRRGGQKLTRLKQVETEVKPLGIDIEQALEQSQNRKYWRGQIERITRAKSTSGVKHDERHQSKVSRVSQYDQN